MYDSNLMLLDAATVTGTGAEIVGAFLDLWSQNADIGPVLNEYEVADPPGAGGDIRPLVWQLVVSDAVGGLSADVTVTLEFSDDGSTENGNIVSFGAITDAQAVAGEVRRQSIFRQGRFVRYAVSAFDAPDTFVASLGPVDAGEYTDF